MCLALCQALEKEGKEVYLKDLCITQLHMGNILTIIHVNGSLRFVQCIACATLHGNPKVRTQRRLTTYRLPDWKLPSEV